MHLRQSRYTAHRVEISFSYHTQSEWPSRFRSILETKSQENTSPVAPKNIFWLLGYPVLLIKVTCPIANSILYKCQFEHDDNYFLFLKEIKFATVLSHTSFGDSMAYENLWKLRVHTHLKRTLWANKSLILSLFRTYPSLTDISKKKLSKRVCTKSLFISFFPFFVYIGIILFSAFPHSI